MSSEESSDELPAYEEEAGKAETVPSEKERKESVPEKEEKKEKKTKWFGALGRKGASGIIRDTLDFGHKSKTVQGERARGKDRAKRERDKQRIKRLELKALKGDTFSPVWRFLKANTIRFGIIAESVWYVPFDFSFHFFMSISQLILLLSVGIVWILVWAAVESIALYARDDVLIPLWILCDALIGLLDFLIDWLMLYIFGPVVLVVQAIVCYTGLIEVVQLSGDVQDLICNAPGFTNPFVLAFVSYDTFVHEFWNKLSEIGTTCAEFSTGVEVTQVMFKLIFSPYVCPVIQHVRPVGWLHAMFYNMFGWMTWEMGIKSSYEDPLARSVTGHIETRGVSGNVNCKAPPEAFFCFMLGIGFMIVEILVPLVILMFIITPLKRIILACIGIGFSVLYHFLEFVVFYTEKLFSSLNWAGKKWAWAVVASLPIFICTLVGFFLYDLIGITAGSLAGALIGSTMAASRGANFFHGPDRIFNGPGWLAIYGISIFVAIVISVPPLVVDLTSDKTDSNQPDSSEWVQ